MSRDIKPRIIRDDQGNPVKYQITINLWSDGEISFNDELCRIDFDGDLVDSQEIEWEVSDNG